MLKTPSDVPRTSTCGRGESRRATASRRRHGGVAASRRIRAGLGTIERKNWMSTANRKHCRTPAKTRRDHRKPRLKREEVFRGSLPELPRSAKRFAWNIIKDARHSSKSPRASLMMLIMQNRSVGT